VVEGAELLVRTDPDEDSTDGFFVAAFERERSAIATGCPHGAAVN
jgi:hypothetical protein